MTCAGAELGAEVSRMRKHGRAVARHDSTPSTPTPTSSLDYTTPLELLVATILSAQCTDERVNEVTPALSRALP